jgi:hypothetical protein
MRVLEDAARCAPDDELVKCTVPVRTKHNIVNPKGSCQLLTGNWIFRGIGSGRGLRGG